MLTRAADALIRLMLAPECACCDTPLEEPLSGPVCACCWSAVPSLTPPWCERCGDALASWRTTDSQCPRCRRGPPVFEVARSAGKYDGSLRRLIHAFKYERRRALAAPLAALMKAAGADLLADADGVVPVPLHPWRALHRGFNQADDLALRLGLPVVRPLRRRTGGPPQAGLPAARRHANVRHAFALRRSLRWAERAHGSRVAEPAGQPRWPWRVRGRTFVLVDDVMTTGATLDACAHVLLDAGARSVRALTVARAVAGPPARSPRTPHL